MTTVLKSLRLTVDEFVLLLAHISYGVPQGSIIGPIIFSLYMLPPGHIIKTVALALSQMQNANAICIILYTIILDSSLMMFNIQVTKSIEMLVFVSC